MARFIERPSSREEKQSLDSHTLWLRLRVVIDMATEDEADVWALVDVVAPDWSDGWPLKSRELIPIEAGIYDVNIYYDDTNESELTFDTTGGTAHITHAYDQIGPAGASGEAFMPLGSTDPSPDLALGINVTRNAIEGVDVVVPAFHLAVTWRIPDDLVTEEYILRLRDLTGCVNECLYTIKTNDRELSFYPGELRFDGVRGRKTRKDVWELVFTFSSQRNVDIDGGLDTPPIIIGTIFVDYKRGWDYLSVFSTERVDSTGRFLIRQPVSVHVMQVYLYDNFDKLHPAWDGSDCNPSSEPDTFKLGNGLGPEWGIPTRPQPPEWRIPLGVP